MSDPMVLELKMAGYFEETADICHSRQNSSRLKMLILESQVQLQTLNQLKSTQSHQQNQHRTAQETQRLWAVRKQAQDHQFSGQLHRQLSVRRIVQLLVADASFFLLAT